jgi:hypothetical protein
LIVTADGYLISRQNQLVTVADRDAGTHDIHAASVCGGSAQNGPHGFAGQWQPSPGSQRLGRHSRFPRDHGSESVSFTGSWAAQCRSNLVSGRRLRKTGIFQRTAGDFPRFRAVIREIGSMETAC